MRKTFILLLVVVNLTSFGQKKTAKTNWLQDKKEFTGRWRVGFGVDVIEPTGIDAQFYRLSKICTNDFSIIKKMSIGTWVGKEGAVTGSLLRKINGWESGGIRYGIDLKLYIPIILNPYIGIGAEGGSRNLYGSLDFYPDAVGRIGIEQKILGVKLSSTTSLNATIFIDVKYNKCLTKNFSYILPCFGLRFHFL